MVAEPSAADCTLRCAAVYSRGERGAGASDKPVADDGNGGADEDEADADVDEDEDVSERGGGEATSDAT